MKLNEFLDGKIKYCNFKRYPSNIVVKKCLNSFTIYKMFLCDDLFYNDGCYDMITITTSTTFAFKKVIEEIQSGNSYVLPAQRECCYDFYGNLKSFYYVWKMQNKIHRFNGPAIASSDDLRYVFLDKEIPNEVIHFNNNAPSKELNKDTVLEAVLFDRAYGKVVETIYSTQKIPTEKEVFDIIGYS